MATRSRSVKFEQFVLANQHRFPVTVIATEGVYGDTTDKDISNGDIIRLLSVKTKVQAQFDHPLTKKWVPVDMPTNYQGGFLIVSQYGPDHVYTSVAEMALDFPTSVRVLEDVEIQGMLVKRGEGLKLLGVKSEGKIQYLHCLHYPSDIALLVPFNAKGRFSRRQDYTIYTLAELMDKMPVWVQRERNEGLQIRGYSRSIPGIPDDFYGTMYLSKNTYVQSELWDDPGSSGIYDMDFKQDKCIPIHLNFNITPADGVEAEHGPPEDLLTIAESARNGHPVFARCCVGQKALDALDLPAETILVVHAIERRKGLVIKGLTKYFLVPTGYKKTTQFKISGREYTTPFDLWRSKHTDTVRATQTVRAPEHFREARSIYEHDELHLYRKPTADEELSSIVSSGGIDDEMDVVEVVRTKSVAGASLGQIFVPSYVKVHLQEPTVFVGEHSIGDTVRHGTLPLDVTLTKIASGDTLTTDDMLLLNESPLTIMAEREYSVVYLTLLDKFGTKSSRKKNQTAREIPDFLGIKARRIHGRIPITKHCVNYYKPEPRLYRLTLTQYSIMYEKEDEPDIDANYEDVDPKRVLFEADNPPLPPRTPEQIAEIRCRTPVKSPPPTPAIKPNRVPRGGMAPPRHALPTDRSRRPPPILPKHSKPGKIKNTQNSPDVKPKPQPRPCTPHLSSSTKPASYSTTIPQLTPPIDGDITNYDKLQMAGIFTYFGCGEQTTALCLQKEINGAKLCSMRDCTDEELKRELVLENNSQIYSIRHLIKSADQGYLTPVRSYEEVLEISDKTVPKLEPPDDANIANLNVLQMAGLFRHLGMPNGTVRTCLQKKIDGAKLCSMVDGGATQTELLLQELQLEYDRHQIYAIKHFVSKSKLAEIIPEKEPPKDGNVRHYSVKEIAGLMRYLKMNETSVNNCLAKQIDGQKLCEMGSSMNDDQLIRELQIGQNEIFAIKHFITMSSSDNNND